MMLNYKIDHRDLEYCLCLRMVVGKKGANRAPFFILENLYIKATQGNLKMWPYEQLPFI